MHEKENLKQLFEKFPANDIANKFFFFVKVNTNGKLETRTKGILDKCSDLACTKKYIRILRSSSSLSVISFSNSSLKKEVPLLQEDQKTLIY